MSQDAVPSNTGPEVIVERLHELCECQRGTGDPRDGNGCVFCEAADEIDRLRAEIEGRKERSRRSIAELNRLGHEYMHDGG